MYQRVTQEQFCTPAHQQLWEAAEERAAVAKLQAQESILRGAREGGGAVAVADLPELPRLPDPALLAPELPAHAPEPAGPPVPEREPAMARLTPVQPPRPELGLLRGRPVGNLTPFAVPARLRPPRIGLTTSQAAVRLRPLQAGHCNAFEIRQGEPPYQPKPAVVLQPRLQVPPQAPEIFTARGVVATLRRHWSGLRQFWALAPTDLRWLAIALPLIVAVIAGYALSTKLQRNGPVSIGLPAIALAAPPRSGPPAPVIPGMSAEEVLPPLREEPQTWTGWERVRRRLAERAAVELIDDFRSGLGQWYGRGDWAHNWNYYPQGFLQPGDLGLYRPSMELTDYRLEFLAQLSKGGMGWVYRARDPDNYYASRLVQLSDGPLPTLAIQHYAVVNGNAEKTHERVFPKALRSESLNRVRVDVKGNEFTISLQGMIVDHWNDDRITSGGVGFFCRRSEVARLHWVEVTHQYDLLGRLCAYLAPLGSRSRNSD